MASGVRYTAAKAREVENARLVWLDASLREEAAQTLDENLAARALDETVEYREEDRDAWADRHAALVARVDELPAGDEAHAHEFGLRKIAKGITRREGERRSGQWLVAPCSCGRVFAGS